MTKDAAYYEDRLWDAWNARVDALGQGLSDAEFAARYEAIEDMHPAALTARIGLHFNEARAIIEQLLDNANINDTDAVYQVFWADRVPELMERGDATPHLAATRAQLLERLHWISSETFGEDLEEWRSWLVAFEANPPLPYSR